MKSSTCFSRSTNIPLSVYFSRSQAAEAAQYTNQRKNSNFIEYQCDRCKYWHLTPLARHTSSQTCLDCTGGDGKNKQLYPTREIAKQRADILLRKKGKHLNVYTCPFNKGWHLTKDQYSF